MAAGRGGDGGRACPVDGRTDPSASSAAWGGGYGARMQGAGNSIELLEARVAALERRVEQLEAGPPRRRADAAAPAGSGRGLQGGGWTAPYRPSTLEVSETWIELHEPSARPQLQRLIRQVVEEEGPVTDRLALDRVRRAWGLRRAGGRVQEAFDQAVRQLLARGLVERVHDALRTPGRELSVVRVPGDDEQTKRAAEDVPLEELVLALEQAARELGSSGEDELTMAVAKLFGWTRRGGSIQERLDAALDRGLSEQRLQRQGERIEAASAA